MKLKLNFAAGSLHVFPLNSPTIATDKLLLPCIFSARDTPALYIKATYILCTHCCKMFDFMRQEV